MPAEMCKSRHVVDVDVDPLPNCLPGFGFNAFRVACQAATPCESERGISCLRLEPTQPSFTIRRNLTCAGLVVVAENPEVVFAENPEVVF